MAQAAPQALLALNAWQWLAIVVKAMTYASTFAASGGVLFLAMFRRQLAEREAGKTQQFVARMALAGLTLSVLRIAVMNGMLTDELAGMLDMTMTRTVLQSSEGPATALRIASLVVITAACRMRLGGVVLMVALCAAGVASASFALVGHAGEAATERGLGGLPQALLSLHLLAIAFWLGALWPLHRLTHGSDMARITAVMERFGVMALGVVGLLVAVGTMLLWLLLGTPSELWTTTYGQLFVVKLSWVAAILALAAVNKFWLASQLGSEGHTAAARLRHSIRAEMLMAGLILVATSGLTSIVGPGD